MPRSAKRLTAAERATAWERAAREAWQAKAELERNTIAYLTEECRTPVEIIERGDFTALNEAATASFRAAEGWVEAVETGEVSLPVALRAEPYVIRRTAREMTREEVRAAFLDMIWQQIHYWHTQAGERDEIGKLTGLAFSILTLLDGDTGLPRFIVAPDPHPSDKREAVTEGSNWWPQNIAVDGLVRANIAGGLHEHLYRRPAAAPYRGPHWDERDSEAR